MVGVLDVDPQLLEREHGLAAHVRAGVERGQVEVAAFVEHLRRARVAEQEVLELGAHVERLKAHRLRALDRPAQHVARVALIRRALGGDHVAEHPPDALLLRAPRQHRERGGIGHRDHVRLLDRVEARDRGPVEAHPRLERVVELGGVDRERLQLAEDVGEPEADEADLALGHERLDVLGCPRRCRPSRRTLDDARRARLSTGGQNEGRRRRSAGRPPMRLSDRRRRRRSSRPLRLPCPGRAAPASARGRGRGLRRSRFPRAPCARPRWRCRRRRARRGSGRCGRPT